MSVCSAVGLTIVSMVPHCESVLMTLGQSGQVGEDQVMLGEWSTLVNVNRKLTEAQQNF